MARTRLPRCVAAGAALLLASCGGGVFLGFSFGDDDGAPEVSLAVSPTAANPGETVQLAAAASDESGIDDVQFFRIDDDTAVSLGIDGSAPFQWSTIVPGAAAGSSVRYFARATDGVGRRSDSNVVVVTVGR